MVDETKKENRTQLLDNGTGKTDNRNTPDNTSNTKQPGNKTEIEPSSDISDQESMYENYLKETRLEQAKENTIYEGNTGTDKYYQAISDFDEEELDPQEADFVIARSKEYDQFGYF